MSARKKSWLGIAKSFVKAVEKEYSKSQAYSKQQNPSPKKVITEPTYSFTITTEDGESYISGMPRGIKDPRYVSAAKEHLGKLVNFYKLYASKYQLKDGENPAAKFIVDLFPKADAHTCPYCGVIHEFKATRARKCPECQGQLVVRQGKFLSEEQVEKFETFLKEFYDKSSSVHQLKTSIERAQSDINDNDLGGSFLALAEGYQYCAMIFNKKDEGGFSAWDYSWRILNNEALQIATSGARDERSLLENGYTEVMFARGMQCLRQLKFAVTDASKQKFALIAISHFYDYLIVLHTYHFTDWHEEEAIKYIHIATKLGNVTPTMITETESRAIDKSPIKHAKIDIELTSKKVSDYVFLEDEPDRLEQYIY